MPNWCNNELKISTGNNSEEAKEQLKHFIQKAKGKHSDTEGQTDLKMENFVPCPKELLSLSAPNTKNSTKMIEKHGYKDWYDWQVSNWGTKWDIDATKNEGSPTCVNYSYSSAWAPNDRFIKRVSELYPLLRFNLEYYEPGVGFKGTLSVRNGDISDDTCEDMTREDLIEYGYINEDDEEYEDDNTDNKPENWAKT